jgi:hypothetical protein
MKDLLDQAALCSCPHSEMTVRLIQALVKYKQQVGFNQDDFPSIAKEILDYIAVRVSNPDLLPSYQMFILDKVDMAFKVAIKIKEKVQNTVDESELGNDEMLDIPIEEFQPLVIDEEFDKLIGYNE